MNEPVDRRHFLATTASGAAAVALTAAAGGTAMAAAPATSTGPAAPRGRARALTGIRPFPLGAVTLLPSACRGW